jgi:succinylglutamic semialdehyde dehydrogenase
MASIHARKLAVVQLHSSFMQTSAPFINGKFTSVSSPDGEIEVRSPSNLDDVVGRHPWSIACVSRAVEAAKKAAKPWDLAGLDHRIAAVRRLRDVLVARESDIALTIVREMGKVLREARAEARALVAKIDLSIDEGLAFTKDFTLEGGRLACRYRPHGVMAVLGPFNFPLHLAHGHIVPALLAGNTVVFKPSEVTPGCGALYAQIIDAAGLPPGVVNVIQGDGRVGALLSTHHDVDGVLFTGSYAVGTHILRANAEHPGRVLALEMGGRNAAIVLDDAPWDKSLLDVLLSAFSTTGQRCTCVSRLIVTRSIADRFVDSLSEMAAKLKVGDPMDPSVFMGPLASPSALARFERYEAMADSEGTSCVRTPEVVRVMRDGVALRGCYVSPRIRRVTRPSKESAYQREEVFGPDVAVWVADDDDHACALANESEYGLAAGVWTVSETRFEAFARSLHAGCIAWNTPTVGSSSRLPFGGLKNSGNHRPAGIFSSMYCCWPLALTRGTTVVDANTVPPGVY